MELGKFINLIDTNISTVQHMCTSIFNFLNIVQCRRNDGGKDLKAKGKNHIRQYFMLINKYIIT
jgi:hypothetical protein